MEPKLRKEPCTTIATKTDELKQRHKQHIVRSLIISVLLACVPPCQLASTLGVEPSSDILEKIAANNVKRYAVAFSVLREYKLRNLRFEKEATASVEVTYQPSKGMTYTILESSGSPKLAEIVGKVLASEADTSSPAKLARRLISPANYDAYLRGTETMAGRTCFVIDLVPKHKSKYLMKATAWVDRSSYDVVRLEGTASASLSMWIGPPHIEIDFSQIDGLWLPVHIGAVSSGLLLGTSELEIRYCDYVINADHPAPGRVADSIQQSKP
jgi:hypothetical protein